MWNQMWYCWVLVSKHVRRRALGVRPWRLVLTDVLTFGGWILWEPTEILQFLGVILFAHNFGGCETIIAVSSWFVHEIWSCLVFFQWNKYCIVVLPFFAQWTDGNWHVLLSWRNHPLLVKCCLFCTHSYKVGGMGIQIHTIYSSWRFTPFYFHPYVKKIAILTCAYYWHMNCCNIYILTLLWFRGPPISTPTSRT